MDICLSSVYNDRLFFYYISFCRKLQEQNGGFRGKRGKFMGFLPRKRKSFKSVTFIFANCRPAPAVKKGIFHKLSPKILVKALKKEQI